MILRKDSDYFLYLGNQLFFVEAGCVYHVLGTWYLLHEICTSKAVQWLWWLATGHWPVQVRFLMEIVALGQVFFTSTSIYLCQYHSTIALYWSFNTFLSERQAGKAWEPWRICFQYGQKSVCSHLFMLQQNRLLKALLNGLALCTFMHYLSNMDTWLFEGFSPKVLNTLVYDCTHIYFSSFLYWMGFIAVIRSFLRSLYPLTLCTVPF